MAVVEILSLSHPGVEVFATLTEAQLRNRLDPSKGIFIAESPKVISVALDAGYEPVSLLCERRHIEGDAAPIISRCGDIPVYTGPRELLAARDDIEALLVFDQDGQMQTFQTKNVNSFIP